MYFDRKVRGQNGAPEPVLHFVKGVLRQFLSAIILSKYLHLDTLILTRLDLPLLYRYLNTKYTRKRRRNLLSDNMICVFPSFV